MKKRFVFILFLATIPSMLLCAEKQSPQRPVALSKTKQTRTKRKKIENAPTDADVEFQTPEFKPTQSPRDVEPPTAVPAQISYAPAVCLCGGTPPNIMDLLRHNAELVAHAHLLSQQNAELAASNRAYAALLTQSQQLLGQFTHTLQRQLPAADHYRKERAPAARDDQEGIFGDLPPIIGRLFD
jgi:hypothetical protein